MEFSNYFKESLSEFQNFFHDIRNNDLILFGASGTGKDVLEKLKKNNIEVKFFCDNDPGKWHQKFCGITVISPQELLRLKSETVIVISSVFITDIKRQLMPYFKTIYPYLLLETEFYDKNLIIKNEEYIKLFMSSLEDEKSYRIATNIIKHRLTGNHDYISEIKEPEGTKNIYFEPEITHLDENEVFVDCGAYNGDTLLSFIKFSKNRFKNIYLFEPDLINIGEINKIIQNKVLDERVKLIKKGVYSLNTKVNFEAEKGIASAINNNGKFIIETCKLDDVFCSDRVTYIKMDIEGAEKEALIGARNIIRRDKPKLAISIYHKPEDFWEIPKLIKLLVPEYKLYIRHYTDQLSETVCYAVC